jgi:hypothetical protein
LKYLFKPNLKRSSTNSFIFQFFFKLIDIINGENQSSHEKIKPIGLIYQT